MKPWLTRLADALLVPVLWVLWCVWFPYEGVPFTADTLAAAIKAS